MRNTINFFPVRCALFVWDFPLVLVHILANMHTVLATFSVRQGGVILMLIYLCAFQTAHQYQRIFSSFGCIMILLLLFTPIFWYSNRSDQKAHFYLISAFGTFLTLCFWLALPWSFLVPVVLSKWVIFRQRLSIISLLWFLWFPFLGFRWRGDIT